MSYLDLARSHTERCLQDVWDACRVQADGDGDYPFRRGTAAGYVRVEGGEPVLVRVWAIAAFGVRRSAKLLAELNSVSARARSVAVFWVDGAVIARQTLLAEAVTREALAQACDAVGTVADDIGTLIASVYGGQTPFTAEAAESADEQTAG